MNYTTHYMRVPLYFRSQWGIPIKNRRHLVNHGKRRKLSGVRASLGDIFCFFSSQISIDLFNIDADWIAFLLKSLEHFLTVHGK